MSFYEITVEQRDYFYFSHVKKESETPPHFHGALELLFCVNGAQEVCIGGKTHTLEKGDGCFIDGYVVHSLKPSGAELYAIVGDSHFFQSVFSAFGNAVPPRIFHFENAELLSLLHALHTQKKRSVAGVTETNKGIVKILLAQLYDQIPFVKRKEDKQNSLVAKILQYAADNLTGDLSLAAISSRFGYSHTYLSRVLHRYLCLHWNIYVGNLRARAVHVLLQNDADSSVLDAAFACGFDSLNTFYRAYRRTFGKTPIKK